ncbi:FAD-dependent monooxygenase [Mucilaginibacter sp. RB4R14]|uniref:FAD-dependent oxidoreductase n=1 Tax=Mucilaginibacter aurantiaciroseus TaxID=2949308 RepID=UPI002091C898|nr:FAD-dependent monooxygenase [Mucilaginibacter aurantiaciroseus]MCO5937246.1 FAD-dependent monooxygenase [Mucilaginibacter aurantiaciroseus]
MITLPQHTNVLIVGAGPSGLMMAAQLLRNGVQPIIIDIKQGPTNQSKALAVQARSLEIYRQLGVIDKVISGGKQAGGMAFNMGGELLAAITLKDVGNTQTLYPFIHLYQQSKNERTLLEYLTTACCPVYWETTLISLKQNKDTVEVTVQNGDTTHNLTCDYVVGADGAHSVVRKQLAIPFNGDTYQHKFFLADVKLASEMPDDILNMFLAKNSFAAFFPMPEERSFRIVASLPDGLEDKGDLNIEDVLPDLKATTAIDVHIEQVNWFTIYKLHHRMADRFSDGRCFLIGDAAHIHSPVGGQGMNTGLQDAYNLSWKLAAVINGQIKEAILTSYAIERVPVAKDLLNTTDRIFNIITSRTWFNGLLKRYVVPNVLKLFWKNEKLREFFFRRVSQTCISYRDSKINLQLSRDTKIKAGDRLPYLKIFDEKKKTETDIHAWCSKPGFTLITLGEIKEDYLFTLAKWITQDYQGNINFFHLPPSNTNWHVFEAFEVKPGMRKALLIRPDLHIGYMNDLVDIGMMNNYLRNVVGFIAQK